MFAGLLILLVSVFTVLGVSQVMELGSAAFFFVVVAGVLVLLCFFCGLIAYARAKLLSVHNGDAESAPVFYFLQTIHRAVVEDPVPDEAYWLKHEGEKVYVDEKLDREQCPVCLCDMDATETATGVSACCKREIHVKCAQDYFNTIRHVKCVFCRKDIPSEDANITATTVCPTPPLPQESSV